MNPIDVAGGASIAATAPRRVFLSHTSDLGKHTEPGSFVAAAVEAVLRVGHAVTDMAYFGARDTSPADYCGAMVTRSDVYVGIIGLRYGAPARDGPELSYTELEFEVATERGLPRLIFLIHEMSPFLPRPGQSAEHLGRQQAFRDRLVEAGVIVNQVASPAELELGLYQALAERGPTPESSTSLAETFGLDEHGRAALGAGAGPSVRPTELPVAPSGLIGREVEKRTRVGMLSSGRTRLVTLTGPGGVGKTRLAIAAAEALASRFGDGLAFVALAALRDPV